MHEQESTDPLFERDFVFSMSQSFDIAIVGLGAMGSAAAYHLTRRHKTVVAFDSYLPPHSMGSTHGESRVIREAYFEHPLYVPLAQRAYQSWHELEAQASEHLLVQTGGVLLGPPDGTLISGTRLSADRHGLNYEMLQARVSHCVCEATMHLRVRFVRLQALRLTKRRVKGKQL